MAEEFTSCIASDLHHAQILAIITLVAVGSIHLDNTYFSLSEYDRGNVSALIHIILLPSHICMLLLGIFFAYITVRGENIYIKGTESMLAIGIILSYLCTIAVAFTSFMVEPVEWEERTGYRKQQETAKTIGENATTENGMG